MYFDVVKDADYFISAVRHIGTRYRPHIAYVRRHVVRDGNTFHHNQYEEVSRLAVVADLKSNVYMTVYWKNDKWIRGSRVHHVHEHGTDYLSTNPNETTRDNLDELPTFCEFF